MKLSIPFHSTKVTGMSLALVSLLVGATALAAADFGAPGWLFVPLLIWLTTLGLPSTIAILAAVSIWGTREPLYGFAPFLLFATLLAVIAQILAVKTALHFWRRGL